MITVAVGSTLWIAARVHRYSAAYSDRFGLGSVARDVNHLTRRVSPGAPWTYLDLVRRLALGFLVVLAMPASAVGKGRLAPPGNSGVSQYVESVPTAGGGQPTTSVHPLGGPGARGGSGRGGRGPGSGAGGTIPAATQRALDQQGADGRSAAALALATAPATFRGQAGSGRSGNAGAYGGSSSTSPSQHASASSPVSSVFRALTGSSSSGSGLGVLLPIILVVCALLLSVVAVLRRRRTT